MHQNVCRMKCANVLCTKISKNGFILHLKGLKSANYFSQSASGHPVLGYLYCKNTKLQGLYTILEYGQGDSQNVDNSGHSGLSCLGTELSWTELSWD